MADPFQIANISSNVVEIPLKRPFVTHLHTVNAIQAVTVTLTLANGITGQGAATPNEVVTGDNIASLQTIVDQVLAPRLLGRSLAHPEPVLAALQNEVAGNSPAKAALDIAIYGCLRQLYQVPLTQLLGGTRQAMNTDYTISIGPREQMVTEAQQLVQDGFTALKIKVGNTSIADDVATVKAIGQAVGSQISLRLDVNQGWNYKQALRAGHLLQAANLNIAFLEQPLPANRIHDLALLRQQLAIPLMLDESVFTPADALRVIEAHAADFVNIKLMKSGGIYAATQINQLCQAAGIHCMVGCMIEAPTSIGAAVAFANAHQNIKFIDLDSVYMMKDGYDTGRLHMVGTKLWLS